MQRLSIKLIMLEGLITASLFFTASAQEVKEEMPRQEFSGYVAFESGQIYKGRYKNIMEDLQHQWIGRVYVNLVDQITMSRNLKVFAGIEVKSWYNSSPVWKNDDVLNGPPAQHYDVYLTNAEGVYSIGQPDNPILDIGIGLFPVKYNPDSRNLGEYLFRTGTYPAYILTTFDLPLERVTGINLHSSAIKGLRLDMFLTTMRNIRPFYDFTITGLVNYSAGSIIDVGAGVSLANFLSVEGRETTPKVDNNMFRKNASDSGYYTFKGTKLMGRLSFDPKVLLPFRDIFGREDLKFYGEAAILGLENYPASNLIDTFNTSNVYGYDKLSKKMPVMMGFNIPAFKILEVLSLEFEWYGCRYPNNYDNVTRYGTPLPDQLNQSYSAADYNNDNWKWSLYGKGNITKGFSLILQFARDHMRLDTYNKKDQDFEDALVRPNHWYWMAKARYDF